MSMTDVTRILNAIEGGDAKATDELLPLVYEELRLLAAQKLSHERPGQTLQATALVHEAYLKLVDQTRVRWQDRVHFFAVAAQATEVGDLAGVRAVVNHADQQEERSGRQAVAVCEEHRSLDAL